MVFSVFKKIRNNGIFKYLFTRYLTYFLQFLSSIIIAAKLDPFYFGVWGFILLIINYYRVIDFGISNSTNVLLVLNKNDEAKSADISSNAVFAVSILGLIITLFTAYYYLFGIPLFDKYQLGQYFYIISIIGIIANFNVLFMNIYRVKNRIKEISICQSVIPFLVTACAIIFSESTLLLTLIGSYLLGNLLSISIFLKNRQVPRLTGLHKATLREIFNKAFYLFLYNIAFYLIIISIKTLISIYYTVDEFGLFSFAYSLANSILLFLQALTFIVAPKIIDKLKGNNYKEISTLIMNLRSSFVTLSFGLIFLGTILYPVLLYFVPKYEEAYNAICLCALAVVLYSNSFGYGSFLMAQNKERVLAGIALGALIVNIAIALLLILVFEVSYEFVIFGTVGSYALHTFLSTYFASRYMDKRVTIRKAIALTFPVSLFLPYVLNLGLNIMNYTNWLWLPLLVFLFLNYRKFGGIVAKFKVLLNNPKSINI